MYGLKELAWEKEKWKAEFQILCLVGWKLEKCSLFTILIFSCFLNQSHQQSPPLVSSVNNPLTIPIQFFISMISHKQTHQQSLSEILPLLTIIKNHINNLHFFRINGQFSLREVSFPISDIRPTTIPCTNQEYLRNSWNDQRTYVALF